MAELIQGLFVVLSKSSGKTYLIDKNLHCNCEGYKYRKTCKHVKEVIKELKEGKFGERVVGLAKEYAYNNNRLLLSPAKDAKFFKA